MALLDRSDSLTKTWTLFTVECAPSSISRFDKEVLRSNSDLRVALTATESMSQGASLQACLTDKESECYNLRSTNWLTITLINSHKAISSKSSTTQLMPTTAALPSLHPIGAKERAYKVSVVWEILMENSTNWGVFTPTTDLIVVLVWRVVKARVATPIISLWMPPSSLPMTWGMLSTRLLVDKLTRIWEKCKMLCMHTPRMPSHQTSLLLTLTGRIRNLIAQSNQLRSVPHLVTSSMANTCEQRIIYHKH